MVWDECQRKRGRHALAVRPTLTLHTLLSSILMSPLYWQVLTTLASHTPVHYVREMNVLHVGEIWLLGLKHLTG